MNGVPPSSGRGSGGSSGADFSRRRHELRTPINHILGYSEMLLEDGSLPSAMGSDLRRIHAAGQRLQELIGDYFGDGLGKGTIDLRQALHELRTPVNQIVGYSELLQDLAREQHYETAVPDLRKIRTAALHWLKLAENYLNQPADPSAAVGAGAGTGAASGGAAAGLPADAERRDAGAVRLANDGCREGGAVLLVDDDETNRDMLARRLQRQGYAVTTAASGPEALDLLAERAFDVILLDMLMPGLTGSEVLVRLKADPRWRDMPVIMLSALDHEADIARCIELGAEDYLAKPFNPVFLWARLGACLERKRLQDRERAAFEALRQSERALAGNLNEAAAYVRSILPSPLTGEIEVNWHFQPCVQLGGDAFGYHWLDADHFAFYLLDVCGHGVGAALLSVSVLNTLRAQTLPGVDFRAPAAVLGGLNRTFPMERQNQLYFTIWYGVYGRRDHLLRFSSAGHPPALFWPQPGARPLELRRPAPAIGCLEEATFSEGTQPVPSGARLLVVSDGVYEIPRSDGQTGTWAEFAAQQADPAAAALAPVQRWEHAVQQCRVGGLEDDFSLLDLKFQC